ncbi:MAG: MgtC/SapB family protein [Bryobacteraceae bacterium]
MIDWMDAGLWDRVARLAIAYVLAVPIAWNREREARGAGLRTFPLVAIASCGLMLISERVSLMDEGNHGRILQGLVTGVGFIGAGAILKGSQTIHGTATAASIWNVAIAGAAVGYRLYEVAAVLAIFNLITLQFLTPLKEVARRPENNQPKDEAADSEEV